MTETLIETVRDLAFWLMILVHIVTIRFLVETGMKIRDRIRREKLEEEWA